MSAERLFTDDAPNYASATFPPPRPFQETAHESLRAGLRAGHRCQVIMAPTGAGKSYLGLRIAHEALLRGKKAVFVCDRTTLINQTSDAADRYGLSAHGVMQAAHWRADRFMPFQIASAQTIARREWPDADVIIIDECHTQLKAWTEHIPTCRAAVVGLSATPFSDGLGKLFSRLINATTMHDLTASGVLVPMKVLSCTTPDMAGAETRGGEWTERAAEERGMQIIGDVVSEWARHGQNRKTIVFGATIAHCEELCRQFNEAGIMAAVFTSQTTDAERVSLLKEYRKRDSSLRVLISVEALAKGFDVPDVGCVVDCRPLRKSLSTAIQMWGRGLRSSPETGKTDCILLDHCIASGQRVLTNAGLVPIEQVTKEHLLWDGVEFVSHGGVVSRGIRPIIRYAGLAATADHPVQTALGWRTLGQCADEQIPVVTTGVGRTALRERDRYFTGRSVAWASGAAIHSCALRVRRLWLSVRNLAVELTQRADSWLPRMQSAEAVPEMALCASGVDASPLHGEEGSQVSRLWRQGDRVPFRLRDHVRSLDRGELGHTGAGGVSSPGPHRQRRPLRAGEYSVGDAIPESVEHAAHAVAAADAQVQDAAPGSAVRRYNAALAAFGRLVLRANRGAVEGAEPEAEGQVWDVLNCGPRNRFTCEGLLVHNSGNVIRFREDFERIYFDGLDALDAGEKLDKAIRKEPEEESKAKACPSCGYKPFTRRCMACGHERQSVALVEAQAGEMREVVMLGGKRMGDDRAHVWAQAATYARAHSAPAKQQGRASNIYRDITGQWPPRGWHVDSTPGVEITRPVLNKIRANNIAWSKIRQKVAA